MSNRQYLVTFVRAPGLTNTYIVRVTNGGPREDEVVELFRFRVLELPSEEVKSALEGTGARMDNVRSNTSVTWKEYFPNDQPRAPLVFWLPSNKAECVRILGQEE